MFGNFDVLIVEDAPVMARLLSTTAEIMQAGSIAVVPDGEEAAGWIRRRREGDNTGVILVNLACGAPDVLRMAQSAWQSDIRVIVTSRPMAGAPRRAAEALRADGFLTIPFSMRSTIAVVADCMTRGPAAGRGCLGMAGAGARDAIPARV